MKRKILDCALPVPLHVGSAPNLGIKFVVVRTTLPVRIAHTVECLHEAARLSASGSRETPSTNRSFLASPGDGIRKPVLLALASLDSAWVVSWSNWQLRHAVRRLPGSGSGGQ